MIWEQEHALRIANEKLYAEVERLKDELHAKSFALDVTGRDKDILKRREAELRAENERLTKERDVSRAAVRELVDAAEKLRRSIKERREESGKAENERLRAERASRERAGVDALRDVVAENEHLGAEIERLRAALTQSNRYIDEAVKKRTLYYDEAVAKHGARSAEARQQSKLLHDFINGTRNSFDSVHRALALTEVKS